MKPAAFEYQRAETAAEAAAVLAQLGDEARILAGGQSLMAVLNMRLARPQRLVDISRSKALAELRVDGAMLHVGAAVTQATLEWRPGLAQELPLLALAFPHISHFQIRNRGTVAGSIAHLFFVRHATAGNAREPVRARHQDARRAEAALQLSLIHISEPTRPY